MTKEFKAQEGGQQKFLNNPADIIIYGGEAGAAKSFGLLLEASRHINNGKVRTLMLRRTTTQLREQGSLWDTSFEIYPFLGGKPNSSFLKWIWKSGYTIKMSHLEYEKDVYNYDGSQIPVIMFDELRYFTELQFFYMLTRNRSTSGIRPYIRATTNPEPDGWLRELVDWYIDEDGFANEDRSGVIRYFVRLEDKLKWSTDRELLIEECFDMGYELDDIMPKSFTFIHGKLEDNLILKKQDPFYKSNILAQNKIERQRLLGNWNSRGNPGDYFHRSMFEEIGELDLPSVRKRIRFWDRAATEKTQTNNPDATVGILQSKCDNWNYYIEDMPVNDKDKTGLFFKKPGDVEKLIYNYASHDGKDCVVGLSQDPAGAGKFEMVYYVKRLAAYEQFFLPESGSKEVRAAPVSSQAEHGMIKIVKGDWNDTFYNWIEKFPGKLANDVVDSLSGGFHYLTSAKIIDSINDMKTANSRAERTKKLTKSSKDW